MGALFLFAAGQRWAHCEDLILSDFFLALMFPVVNCIFCFFSNLFKRPIKDQINDLRFKL